MGFDPISIAVIGGLAIAGGGTYSAAKNSKKSAQAAQEANTIQRQQNDLQAARQKRDAVRQARSAYASAQQTGANQGVSDSSAGQGGLASIATQLGDTLSFLDTYNKQSDQASEALGRSAVFSSKAQAASGWASFGLSVASSASSIGSVFAPKPKAS